MRLRRLRMAGRRPSRSTLRDRGRQRGQRRPAAARRRAASSPTAAGISWPATPGPGLERRGDSRRRKSFTSSWIDEKGVRAGDPIEVYVPPGGDACRASSPRRQRQAASAAASPATSTCLTTRSISAPRRKVRKRPSSRLPHGPDAADDPSEMLYYPSASLKIRPAARFKIDPAEALGAESCRPSLYRRRR